MNERQKKKALKSLNRLDAKIERLADKRERFACKVEDLDVTLCELNQAANQIIKLAKLGMSESEYHKWIMT